MCHFSSFLPTFQKGGGYQLFYLIIIMMTTPYYTLSILRECNYIAGGELFSQRFEGYTLHVTALFEQVVVSWARPSQPHREVGLAKETLDNRWHWVGLRYNSDPPSLLLEVDRDTQVRRTLHQPPVGVAMWFTFGIHARCTCINKSLRLRVLIQLITYFSGWLLT